MNDGLDGVRAMQPSGGGMIRGKHAKAVLGVVILRAIIYTQLFCVAWMTVYRISITAVFVHHDYPYWYALFDWLGRHHVTVDAIASYSFLLFPLCVLVLICCKTLTRRDAFAAVVMEALLEYALIYTIFTPVLCGLIR